MRKDRVGITAGDAYLLRGVLPKTNSVNPFRNNLRWSVICALASPMGSDWDVRSLEIAVKKWWLETWVCRKAQRLRSLWIVYALKFLLPTPSHRKSYFLVVIPCFSVVEFYQLQMRNAGCTTCHIQRYRFLFSGAVPMRVVARDHRYECPSRNGGMAPQSLQKVHRARIADYYWILLDSFCTSRSIRYLLVLWRITCCLRSDWRWQIICLDRWLSH